MSDKNKLRILIGLLLGVFLAAALLMTRMILIKETGEFNLTSALAVTGGIMLGGLASYLLAIRKKKVNGNVPEVDERTVSVLKNYFVMIGTGVLCLVLYFMDITTIELGAIFVYLAIIYIVVAIGAFIAKRV